MYAMAWTKKSHQEIKEIVFSALDKNVNYSTKGVLGIPASYLDDKVFNQDDAFLGQCALYIVFNQKPKSHWLPYPRKFGVIFLGHTTN